MSNYETIIDKILADSAALATDILSEADALAKGKISAGEQQGKKLAFDIITRANERAADIKKRSAAVTDLERRKQLLASRRIVMDEVYRSAISKSEKLDVAIYGGIIEKLLSDVENIEGELFVPKGQSELFSGRNITQDETVKSGFVLKHGGMELNCTLPALIAEKREKTEMQVSKILFN